MARSYDGHEWELTRQTNAITLQGCNAAGCDATIPSDANSYAIDVSNGSAIDAHATLPLEAYVRRVAARHLMRASFGPTNATVEALTTELFARASPPPPLCAAGFSLEDHSSAHGDICRALDGSNGWAPPAGCEGAGGRWAGPPYAAMPYTGGAAVPCDHAQLILPLAARLRKGLAAHVAAQMALPPSLHRVYNRERSNPRIDHHHSIGPLRSACDRGSRWHAAALTVHDVGSYVSISTIDGVAVLFVDGTPRTELLTGWITPYLSPPPPPPNPSQPPPEQPPASAQWPSPCPANFVIEDHSSSHGDICRAVDGSGSWVPPSGCETASGRWSGAPYSAMPYMSGTPTPCDHTQLPLRSPPMMPEPGMPPPPAPPTQWQICTVQEGIGLRTVLARQCQCNGIGGLTNINDAGLCYDWLSIEPIEVINPPIVFTGERVPTDTMFVTSSNATVSEVVGVAGDCPPGHILLNSVAQGTSNEYGYRCIAPINSTDCPDEVDLTNCDQVRPNGALCHGPLYHLGNRIINCPHPTSWDWSKKAIYRAVQPTRSHVVVVSELRVPCTFSTGVRHSDAFLHHQGVFYHHDQRMQLVENTLDAPTNLSSVFEHSHAGCPNVRKTFLNAHTCVRRRTCRGLQYSQATVELNHSTIRRFYEVGNMYVYAVTSLRDGWSDYSQTLCSHWSTTRWMNIGPAAPSLNTSALANVSDGGSLTHPLQCAAGRCCGVLFRGASGANCNPVPIWVGQTQSQAATHVGWVPHGRGLGE